MRPSFLVVLDDFYPVQHAPAVRVRSFLEALARHDVTLVAGCTGSPPGQPFSYRMRLVPRPSERNPLRFLAFLVRLAQAARRLARRHAFDCIVVSVPKFELLLAAGMLRRHCRHLILDFRDSLGFLDYEAYCGHFLPRAVARPLGRITKAVISRALSRACRQASLITAANAAIAASLAEHERPVITIANGVDTTVFRRVGPMPGPPIALVYAGNFAEKDRFEPLAQALPALNGAVVLHVVGEGRNKPAVLRTLAAAGVTVVDHGVVPHGEMPALLSTMHVGVLFRSPTATESIPVALYECCALGIPVMVNDVGVMAEFVRQHNLGWVAGEPGEIRDVLRGLAADPARLNAFSHLRPLAEQRFSRTRQGEAMRTALLRLVAGEST